MKTFIFLAGLLILFGNTKVSAQNTNEARLLRFPHINAGLVVFSYAGDLYSVPENGGLARKLTSNPGYEMFAKISPDGKFIAFTGQYDGNTEVYIIPSAGGEPKRLTYTATLDRDEVSDRMGPNNIVTGWTPDSKKIIYRSRCYTFNDFTGQLFMVSVTGGMPEEIPLTNGGFNSFSGDGTKLAFNRVFREFRSWKYYTGGMADDVWIYDFTNKSVTNVTNNNAQDIFPMYYQNNVYFISDRDRTMNLFVYNTTNKTTAKITDFTDFDIKFPAIGGDKIIFENGGFLYVYNITTNKTNKLTITIQNDYQQNLTFLADASKFIRNTDVSPGGERILFSARGDIYSVPATKGVTRNITKSSGAHDRNAVWSPDGKTIAYISDLSGEFEIYTQKEDGSEPPVQITKTGDTYMYAIKWSPDSKKILWSDKMLRLRYVDLQTRQITEVDNSVSGEFIDYNWSPDSKWIVYTRPEAESLNKIRIYNLLTKQKNEITDGWQQASQPVFSADGKYLFFVSNRTFNPVYSDTEWNTAYKDMSRIYLLTLEKNTPSPFATENTEVGQNLNDSILDNPKNIQVKIDFDGINNRIFDLPLPASNYANLSVSGNKLYYTEKNYADAENTLKMFHLRKKEETEIMKGVDFVISANGKKMLIVKRKDFYVIDLPENKTELKTKADLGAMFYVVNLAEEWRQIYYESWRQMRDFFFDPGMQGVNWPAIRDKYAVLLPYIRHRDDLTYIISEMISELNIGHAYINSPEKNETTKTYMGLLGAKFSKDNSGYFKIDKILNGANWDKTIRSPLQEPGVDVKTGDFILSVNGISTKNVENIFELLVNTAGKTVEMQVNTKPDIAGSRKIFVVPLKSEASLYYYTWVQNNIEKVNSATNQQAGYIHIPDMSAEGLNEFVKYFYPQLSKKGLIIDDRGNGGGNVSPMIIERLRREMVYANSTRNIQANTPTPRQTHIGPKVMLINNYSASDGDLFPFQFKTYQMGKIIGVRSWGGVTGIRGSLPFIDGADLRKPEFAKYSKDGKEWIIEGHGVDPDILIDNDPAKEYSGEDAQLNKAIEVIMEEIKNFKEYLPPAPPYPKK